jgi:holo-[acyl-carrier protein] synthase
MKGIGIDICNIKRFERLSCDNSFINRIFTENEIIYCNSRKRKKSEAFAVRFAAKEAFSKAIGTGFRKGVSLREIEIIKDEFGKPSIVLYGETKDFFYNNIAGTIFLSLSHEKEMAIAMVVVE